MKMIKRLLAVILCVSMVAGIYWPGTVSKAEDVTDAEAVYSLNEDKMVYALNGVKHVKVYEDNFLSSKENYDAAVGDYFYKDSAMDWQIGSLYVDYTEDTTKCTLFCGINEAQTLQNYSVSADVRVNAGYGCVIGYGNPNEDSRWRPVGYEFGVVNGKFRIYRPTSTPGQWGYGDGDDVTDHFTSYVAGAVITLRLEINTNSEGNTELKGYAEYGGTEALVIEAMDTSEYKLTSGAPGVTTNRIANTVTSVSVIKEVADNSNVLYADDFTYKPAYEAAKGTTTSNLQWSQGGLQNTDGGTYFVLFNGITDTTNYKIEADLTFSDMSNGYCGIVANGTEPNASNTCGYEFAIVKGNFRLYPRCASNSSYENLAGGTATYAFSTIFGAYEVGKTIHLAMITVTNADNTEVTLICTATYNGVEKIIFRCEDATYKITSGVPGIRGTSMGSTVQSVCVTEYDASVATDYSLPYSETFEDGYKVNEQWSNGAEISIVNGQAVTDETISTMYLQNDALSWSKYEYEATVTMTNDTFVGANAKVAAICAGADVEDESGYELGLVWQTQGTDEVTDDEYYVRLYHRGEEVFTKIQTFAFTLGESVTLKMVLNSDKIECYANGMKLENLTHESSTLTFDGTIGIRSNGISVKYDDISVTEIDSNYYEISPYRGEKTNFTHPTKAGFIFGGWYTDITYFTPMDETVCGGTAYAKWVAEEVLSVKAQLPAPDPVDEDGRTIMRIVTTVDCEDYIEVGFDVSTTYHSMTYTDTRFFSSIQSRYDSIKVDYTPSEEFHETSDSFATIILTNLRATGEHLTKDFTIKPFWKTADGTKVYGVTRVLTIQEGINAMNGQGEPYSL